MSNSQQRFGLAQINASLAHVLHSLFPFSPSEHALALFLGLTFFYGLYWILLILELFIRDGDNYSESWNQIVV